MRNFINRVVTILGSKRFFWVIFGFFIFESVWIALSAVYPMAFDEDFHFGLIKIYSHYWLPFLSTQPPNANAFGAVARDPSYLYHYLMSFPYRVIALVVHGQTAQVILLRFINIGLFGSALVLFRQVLLRVKVSRTLTNLSLLLFVLIPIVPQLAAHINYDNLLIPLIAWTCLLTFRAIDEIRQKKPSMRTFLILGSICMFAALVQYAFLPVFLAVLLFLSYVVYRSYRHKFGDFPRDILKGWRKQSLLAKIVLICVFVISFGMFAERDGVNLVKYHTFTPNCSSILSVNACSSYGAWDRNYTTHQAVLASPTAIRYFNPIEYVGVWSYWIWYRLFFAINGPASGFTNYPPLPLPSAAAAIIGIVGVVAIIKWRRQIFRGNSYLAFFFVVCLLYLLALWIDGYAQYRYTNELVFMNGRYVLPILIPMVAIAGRAFSIALRKSPARKSLFAVVTLLLFFQGGGVLTFITRSDSTWDWPNSVVVKVNNAAREVTRPVVVKGSKTYSTKVWVFN
jgi:hypothetical protein